MFRKEATSIVSCYLLFRCSLETDGEVKNGAGSFTVNVDMVGASDQVRSGRPMSRTTSSAQASIGVSTNSFWNTIG